MEIERETGRTRLVRAVSAIDSGQAVNPNGIINQTEGGILQAMSWTLYEAVTFDRTRITSVDWASYPILRFASVPDSVEVHVIDRPGQRLPRHRRGGSRADRRRHRQCDPAGHRQAPSTTCR